MKKFGLLGLFMVLSLVLLGIGYASWTDTLTSRTTVQTGEFEVIYRECSGIIRDIWDEGLVDMYEDGHPDGHITGKGVGNLYSQMQVNRVGDKMVTINVTNLYPGVVFETTVRIKNVGSIPAVFDYSTVTVNGNDSLENELLMLMFEIQRIEVTDEFDQPVQVDNPYLVSTPAVNIAGFEGSIDAFLRGFRLEPGETAEIVFTQTLPIEVENDDYVELRNLVYTLQMNFKQHNVDFTTP